MFNTLNVCAHALHPFVSPVFHVSLQRFQVPITRKEDGCIAYAAAVDVAAGALFLASLLCVCMRIAEALARF